MACHYDPVGQLLKAQSAMGQERFAFDPAGNIMEGLEEHVWRRSNEPRNKVPGTHYRYDERGNMVERLHQGRQSTFEWDAFNRMSRAVTGEGSTAFAYDPLGRRIVKQHRSVSALAAIFAMPSEETVTHTVFGWDGDTLAFESSATEGPVPEASTVHYIHEPGSFVPLVQTRRKGALQLRPTTDVKALMAAHGGQYDMDLDPLWSEGPDEPQGFAPEEIAYYQCDHLGTPQELTDHEGQLAWAAQYKAWGQARTAISDAARKAGVSNPIRFQGQYLDEETGLHYNRHRYYDPHSGRFVSKDPVRLAGGNNLQRYAPNPVAWVDPKGLQGVILRTVPPPFLISESSKHEPYDPSDPLGPLIIPPAGWKPSITPDGAYVEVPAGPPPKPPKNDCESQFGSCMAFARASTMKFMGICMCMAQYLVCKKVFKND